MKITLNNNREINLHQLFQYKSYYYIYAGLPTKENWINGVVMNIAVEAVEKKIWCSTKPYIIKPKLTEQIDNGKKYEFIPGYTCIAHFESYKPTKDNKGETLSSLTVVWFQDNWALPIDPEIMIQIQQIDWDKYGHNFDL